MPWSGFLLCVDSAGKEKWRKVYRESDGAWGWVNDVAPTHDGGFVLAIAEYNSELGKRWLLRKTDPQGNPEWDVDAPAGGYADAVQALDDGGYILAGAYRQNGSDDDFFLLKAAPDGNVVWSRTYASLGASLTFTTVPPRLTLRELPDGSLLAAGAGYSSGTFFTLRTDTNGNETGRYVQTTPLAYYLRSVVATDDGGCILGGDDYTPDQTQPHLIKVDSLGQIQWATQLETVAKPAGYGPWVQPRSQGGYAAVLTTRTAVDDPHPGSSAPTFDFNIEAFALTHEGTVLPWPAP